MKKLILSMMAGAILMFCGNFAQAREESKDTVDKQAQYKNVDKQAKGDRPKRKVKRPADKKKDRPGAVNRTRPVAELERSRRGRDTMMTKRRASIQKQIEQKKKVNKAFIGQLNAIRNQAEKEGAEKTIAMLDSLIAKEQKKTAKNVKKLEKDKEKIAEQIEKYKQPGKVQAADKKAEAEAEVEVKAKKAEELKPAEAAKPAEDEKKKKKKWWKFGKD